MVVTFISTMKVAGFSFIRNAVKYDYPIIEAITSILPLCDEFYLALGQSDDATEEFIRSIPSSKIKIIHTRWDDSLREGGRVLAEETNKAFDAIPKEFDWCFYIQGDEVLPEQYLQMIKEAMLKWKSNEEVEGLLFNYRHFYGSYDYIGDSRRWYRNEIRVIKNDKKIRSYRDAQGFRKEGRKLKVKPIEAFIHHYGWVKDPIKQQAKTESFNKLWHNDEWMESNVTRTEKFDYSGIDSICLYKGSHPEVMKARVNNINWKFSHDISKKNFTFRRKVLYVIEKVTGFRIGEYKNYQMLR